LSSKQLHDVFEALLKATNDYKTDRRGDVGSWSRIAAMVGLEKLSLLAVKASSHKIPQFSPSIPSQSKQNVQVTISVPQLYDQLSFLEPNITNRVQKCLKDHKPFREVKESHAVNSFFNVEVWSLPFAIEQIN
jgi:hypothetical protein